MAATRPAPGPFSFFLPQIFKNPAPPSFRARIQLQTFPEAARDRWGRGETAVCSGAAGPALEDECVGGGGGGHSPARPPRRPPGPGPPRPGPGPPTSAAGVLRACPRPRRSRGTPGTPARTPRPPRSPLPPHGAGAGVEFWLQDLLAAADDLDPSIQTREDARPAPAPAPSTPEPGAPGPRGFPRSWGGSCRGVGGLGSEGLQRNQHCRLLDSSPLRPILDFCTPEL
ncbi:basic proline-rich protein-like [Gorilla gorilla gorilla]|uniref:basic proline-rich protein-like n=1 Tax=Gorilla gorilla gorilla TaxID=9595 RepID=UPI00244569AD|nr:basic proline-rich protein-like [Gorilla gorilla gorilla]